MSPEQLVAGLKAHTKRTRVTWQATDDLSLEEWKAAGPGLGLQSRASAWWLGDWVRFGAKHYGLTVAEAAELTQYDEQTLYNMVSIAAKFPVSRRRETLSWSHHADLAALPASEQDEWLNRVEEERMSVQELRKALRRAKRVPRLTATPKIDETAVPITCTHCGATLTLDRAALLNASVQPPAPRTSAEQGTVLQHRQSAHVASSARSAA